MADQLNTDLITALKRQGAEPVVSVGIRIPHIATISVDDWASLDSTNAVFTVSRGGYSSENFTIQAGTDFTAETSNIVTAARIETALRDALDVDTRGSDLYAGVWREPGTAVVAFWSVSIPVEILLSSGSGAFVSERPGTTFYASSKFGGLYGRPDDARLLELNLDSTTLDPINRRMSIGAGDMLLADSDSVRTLFSAFHVRLAPVRVYLAETSSQFPDQVGYYLLDDFTFSSEGFRVRLIDSLGAADLHTSFGSAHSIHPVSFLKELLRNFPPSLVDHSSFDLSNIPENRRALCISRVTGLEIGQISGRPPLTGGETGGGALSSVLNYVEEVLPVSLGMVRRNQFDGRLRFDSYHLDADYDWFLPDADISGFTMETSMDNQIREASITRTSVSDKENAYKHTSWKALHNTPGILSSFDPYVIDSPYMTSNARFDGSDGGGAYFSSFQTQHTRHYLQFAPNTGFSCSDRRLNGSGVWVGREDAAQATAAGLPAGVIFAKYRFFVFSDVIRAGASAENVIEVGSEWIALTPVSHDTTDSSFPGIFDRELEHPNVNTPIALPEFAAYDVATSYNDNGFTGGRTGFSSTTRIEDIPYFGGDTLGDTTTQAGAQLIVEDHTLSVEVASSLINRFEYGAPVVSFSLPLHYAGITVGDVVVFENLDRFVGYRSKNQINATFEVTSVSGVYLGGSVGLRIQATMLNRFTRVEQFDESTAGPPDYTLPGTPTGPQWPSNLEPISGGPVFGGLGYAVSPDASPETAGEAESNTVVDSLGNTVVDSSSNTVKDS